MMPSYQVDSVHVMEKVVVSGSRDRGISVWSIHQVTIIDIICIIAIDQVIIIVIVIIFIVQVLAGGEENSKN